MPEEVAKPDLAAMQEVADAIRELKNWIFEYAREYKLDDQARDLLHEKVDAIAEKLAKVGLKK